MIRHYKISVFGKVQGVWYRKSAKEKATELKIDGVITNQPDGSVFISAQGEEKNLNDFILYCNSGSELAEVRSLQIEEAPLSENTGFKIG